MKKILLLLSVVIFGFAPSGYADIRAGVNYIELPFGDSVSKGRKVVVREFFWYGCPHCYKAEPSINKWRKSKAFALVQLERSPAFLSMTEYDARNERHKMQIRKFYLHARMYYALKKLGKAKALSGKIFDAIHKHNKRFDSMAQVAEFVASKGVNKKRFLQVLQSEVVNKAVHKSRTLELGYGVRSVPIFVVDGRYMTSPSMAGGHDQAIKVINHLVLKVRKERSKK